jgi:hypothetical protein
LIDIVNPTEIGEEAEHVSLVHNDARVNNTRGRQLGMARGMGIVRHRRKP